MSGSPSPISNISLPQAPIAAVTRCPELTHLILYPFTIYRIPFGTENNFYFTFQLAGGPFLGWLCLGWLMQLHSVGGLTGLGIQEALPSTVDTSVGWQEALLF